MVPQLYFVPGGNRPDLLTAGAEKKYIVAMFRFFLKKNFCDVWDNLLHTIVYNLMMLALLGGCAALCIAVSALPGTAILKDIYVAAAFLFSSMLVCVFLVAESDNAARAASYETPKIKALFSNLVPSLKDGMLLGLLVMLAATIATTSIPYYFSIWIPRDGGKGSLLGLLMLSFVFWMLVIFVIAIQWFLPVRSLMHNNFKKCLKKSYIIFFDNMWFSVGVALVNLLNVFITIFTLGILDGAATMLITSTNALRLRLYKYDWYEVNPGLTREQRRDVPWEELLANDRRILGPRKWRSFIFPWKE